MRFLRFPTIFWLNSSDSMHRLVVWLGLVCSIGLVYGGSFSRLFLFGIYVSLFSLDFALGLIYPWDVRALFLSYSSNAGCRFFAVFLVRQPGARAVPPNASAFVPVGPASVAGADRSTESRCHLGFSMVCVISCI